MFVMYRDFLRNETMWTKSAWLDYLQNRFGNFELAIADGDNWSKWRNYLDVRDDKDFIEKANNRTIFPIELVYDVDVLTELPIILRALESNGIPFEIWKSGGKGFHIHIIEASLYDLDPDGIDPNAIVRFKALALSKGDPAKKGKRTMIQLENSPHRKTGQVKCYIGGNT